MSDNAKTELLSIIEANKKNLARLEMIVKKHSEALHSLVVSSWSFPVAPKHFVEQCYAFAYNQSPVCNTGNIKKFESIKKGYACCGRRCPCAIEKKRITMIERYGCEFPLQNEQLRQKTVETCKQRYGVDSIAKAGAEKRAKTCLDRFGSTSPLGNKEILQKTRNSLKESLGVEYVFKSKKIQEKIQDSWIEKNGKKGFIRTKEHGEASAKMYASKHFTDEASTVLFDKEVFTKLLRTMSRVELAKHLNCSYALIDKRVRDFELTEFRNHPSYYEILIGNLLSNHSLEFVKNTRKIIKPKELDFYIPSANFAIEFCGLRWHGEMAGRNNEYHLNKYITAQSKGIRLVQVYQDEWDTNSAAVKSTILHQLKQTKSRIFARKTSVISINRDEAVKFIQTNSMLPVKPSTHYYSLAYNNEVVFVMTVGQSADIWSITNLVTKIGTTVVGGASKVFKQFVQLHCPQTVSASCDLRYFNGAVYEKLGFVYNTRTAPKKYYTKGVHRWLTDPVNTDITKYDTIWDCGQNIYTWQA